VENHVTTGRPTDIKNFMSKFLCKYWRNAIKFL
jgi:hypothetical protein